MTYFRCCRWLLVVIIAGCLAAGLIVWQRHQVEVANKSVELVMEYEDLCELARREGLDRQTVLQQFREAGVTTLAVTDITLEKLLKAGQISVMTGSDLLHQGQVGLVTDANWQQWLARGLIKSEQIYVTSSQPAVFAELHTDLLRRFGSRVTQIAADLPLLGIAGDYEALLETELGISLLELQAVADQGFLVIARPANYQVVQSADIATFFERISQVPAVSAVIFAGNQTLGYPDLLEQTYAGLKNQALTVGLIEHPVQLQFYEQAGLLPLIPKLNYRAARVYSISKAEQPKLLVTSAAHRWRLSDQERNIRFNLLRCYEQPVPGTSLLATNLNYVEQTKQGIVAKGFTLGKAGVFKPYFPPLALTLVAALAVVAAGITMLSQIIALTNRRQLLLFAVVGLVITTMIARGSIVALQATALGAAITFPVLAMSYQLARWAKLARGNWFKLLIVEGLGGIAVTTMISALGALLLAALLADIRFLLELEIFRGVKLTFILPLVLVALIYLNYFSLIDLADDRDGNKLWRQTVALLDYPVAVKTLLVCGLGAIVAWVFIGRSGHTAGVPVPAFEVKLRLLLEQTMYARPREKEFLIGHPAFMVAALAVINQWPRWLHFLLVIGATIGQSTLVETFAHLRTPVYMSFVRGLDGLLLGALLGLGIAVLIHAVVCLSIVVKRRTLNG